MIQGVCRPENRGLPKCVIQLNKTQESEAAKVRGTTRAAVLKGDSLCENLVAVSVYDTKPVHFLSMMCDNIKWVKKSRLIYDKKLNKKVKVVYYRLNVNDSYNNHMGDVDVADQIRGYYRSQLFSRNFKWWHAILWWGMEVSIVNSYKCYSSFMQMISRKFISHYDFHKSIAEDWIDPDLIEIKSRLDPN